MADEKPSDQRVDRRDLLKYTGAGAAGVALAGCKERPTEETPTALPGDATPSGDQPLKGQTYKLGVLAPTPESFPVGTSMVRCAKLAAEELNKNGGIAGAEVEVVVGNTEASPGTASQVFLNLIREEGIDAAFGTFLTQVTLACFQPMTQNEVPLICTAAAGPKPSRVVNKQYDKYKYFFRAGPINSFDLAKAELEFLNLYADQLGWEKAAPLIENIGPFDPFASVLDGNISDYVNPVATGGSDTEVRRTSSGTTNWTPIWDEVERADADVALIAQALTGTASIKQWFNQKRSFEMGGISVPAQVYAFWDEVGGACEYTFTMNAITPQTTNTPRTQPFMKRYRKRFTDEDSDRPTYPVYSGPITYDGIRGFAHAMETWVKQEALTQKPSPDQMVNAMESLTFSDGIVIPDFQFTPKDAKYAHDPQWTSMKESGVPVWQQWQTDPEIREDYGVMHSFAPEQNKTADYSYPDWIDYPSDHPANQ
ncbi:ABC transporter substrate-binding protein [Halorarius halobius]|uniref:ABC transporter substrate-binding protein n=1 Tax=Halorarius halobius TaxID=2962671 RepID=UPI0020CC650A|nr:ABC transporter substrate-binding protein [Halorarius halobius]